jgi:Fur family zinc uptake transcriptional regulator
MTALHHHHRKDQIAAAEAACVAVGETLTPLRRKVFELLLNRDGPAKAYDLLEELRPDHGAAKPPTVYRALDFLVRLGLAHRIESQNAFVACDVGACARSTIFLICEQCGASVEADAGHALSDVAEAAHRAGFALKRTMLEATGLCAECKDG